MNRFLCLSINRWWRRSAGRSGLRMRGAPRTPDTARPLVPRARSACATAHLHNQSINQSIGQFKKWSISNGLKYFLAANTAVLLHPVGGIMEEVRRDQDDSQFTLHVPAQDTQHTTHSFYNIQCMNVVDTHLQSWWHVLYRTVCVNTSAHSTLAKVLCWGRV